MLRICRACVFEMFSCIIVIKIHLHESQQPYRKQTERNRIAITSSVPTRMCESGLGLTVAVGRKEASKRRELTEDQLDKVGSYALIAKLRGSNVKFSSFSRNLNECRH